MVMGAHNTELSRIFLSMADMYAYLGGDDRFRSLAYRKAARTISALTEDVEAYISRGELDDLPGIGEGISAKITEYVRTGKIAKYEALKKKVPADLLQMMDVQGFGPGSLRAIHDQLHISTKEELLRAMEEGKLKGLKGFGEGRIKNLQRGLKLHKQVEDRMLLADALRIGEMLTERLRQIRGVRQAELAGSLRRRKDTIGDLDILITAEKKYRKEITEQFIRQEGVKEVLVKGNTRAGIIWGPQRRQVDLRIVEDDEWGAALLYFTGSKEHNIRLRTLAREMGYKINEYGLFSAASGKKIAGETEDEIYRKLGFRYIPPEMREDRGELNLAARNKLPLLVDIGDIRCDLHIHSTWSDGTLDLAELAESAKTKTYDFIALTDHSVSERVAGGMDAARLKKQLLALKKIAFAKGRIKSGVEVDILGNGQLDLNDALLLQLDWVVASIHSGFSKDNTQRLLQAIAHPAVCCIGHPGGRLIGRRENYPVNWNEVFAAAREYKTALEINAQPQRMELTDELVIQAREAGVKLVISTDAHTAADFDLMFLGVSIARRGWCTPKDILNTWSWEEVRRYVHDKRKQ